MYNKTWLSTEVRLTFYFIELTDSIAEEIVVHAEKDYRHK